MIDNNAHNAHKDGRTRKTVHVDLDTIIETDLEGFLDHILELAGEPLGMDVIYTPTTVKDGNIEILVAYYPPDNTNEDDE